MRASESTATNNTKKTTNRYPLKLDFDAPTYTCAQFSLFNLCFRKSLNGRQKRCVQSMSNIPQNKLQSAYQMGTQIGGPNSYCFEVFKVPTPGWAPGQGVPGQAPRPKSMLNGPPEADFRGFLEQQMIESLLITSCCLGWGEHLRWGYPWDIPWVIPTVGFPFSLSNKQLSNK